MNDITSKAERTFEKLFGEQIKALERMEKPDMSEEELLAYDYLLDKLAAERLLFVDSNQRSYQKGLAEGRAEGIAQGRAEAFAEWLVEVAKKLLVMGMSVEDVAKATGLKAEDIEKLSHKQ